METDRDDPVLAPSAGPPLPLAVRAEGCRIWDADGVEYLDAVGGAMVNALGHCHPRLVAALERQARELTFTYRFSFRNPPMVELAELLREIAPLPQASAFFNSSGSESVESAIHVAVRYWQLRGRPAKVELISRLPSYHGSTLGALGLSGSAWRRSFETLLAKSAVAATPNADIRAGRTPAQEVEHAIRSVEDAICQRGAEHVAAVVVEPISGASGAAVVPPPGYFARLREVCDRHEVLLICDETITGFGRTGAWWGSETVGARPDVVTFAKGVTSGIVPFSGLLVSGAVAEAFRDVGFPYGHTFSGYPLGCAVAAEAIRTIRDDDLLARCRERGERLADGLRRLAAADPRIAEVRGAGLLWGLELVGDPATLAPLAGGAVALQRAARERGLMIYSCPTPIGRTTVEAVLLAPPLTVTDGDVDEILARLADALARARLAA